LGQEFGQSFFVIAFGSGDKMLHFFMVDWWKWVLMGFLGERVVVVVFVC
jgi:hypothetical protein